MRSLLQARFQLAAALLKARLAQQRKHVLHCMPLQPGWLNGLTPSR